MLRATGLQPPQRVFTYDAVNLVWVYPAAEVHPAGIPITITATAVDRPGNRGSLTVPRPEV